MEHPWMMSYFSRYESAMSESYEDRPEWMKRYVPLEAVGDFLANSGLPMADWIADAFRETGTDPINMMSVAPLYRAYKARNMNLNDPNANDGMNFIGIMLDGIDQYGLSMNPLSGSPPSVTGLCQQSFGGMLSRKLTFSKQQQ